MGFALNAFQKYFDTARTSNDVTAGQQINETRLALGKTGGTNLAQTDNALSMELAGKGFNYDTYTMELDFLKNQKDHNLDGFRAFT